MITNKDIRVENGSLILNGDPYPLDGQSPETIMEIVEDNSDTTPTENSTKPVKSGGVYTAIGAVDTKIGDITQTGVTGDSVAAQLDTLGDLISGLSTTTKIWEGYATDVGTIFDLTQNYTDFKYLVILAKTNVDQKTMLIPTSFISDSIVFSDVLSGGAWDATTNAFAYNSGYGIKFTAANKFKLEALIYNNSNWVLRPLKIYGIG